MVNSRQAYEDWHSRYEIDGGANTPWHKLVIKHLEPERDLVGKRILEIGCGLGGFSCWLAKQAERPNHIVAADFAATAVQKGRAFAAENNLSGITWEVADVQNIAHRDATFDTVFSCETIEHVPSPKRALSELARVLRPGGRLMLTTPNYLGTLGLYRAYLRIVGRRFSEEGQPINNFLLLPLTRSWVEQTGLETRTVDASGQYLPFPGRPPIDVPALNHPTKLMRWLAHHSLIIAEKVR
jgi:2-polyprenyl-3-methyl-5-hydroxy-6-metoxy-1,4-benzoquinol methylase